ncbi:MAG: DUF4440 domain-containing protein [Bacteroidales bacterium]|nr:DUF4440 domain-containing protein [Bacteroidales bacterium]MCF8344282.1 DUF4440 domain-containing protein [Bacteroidales bacterium]MCF8351906.1 DUF4440 domain-containing protein [Bacteroidales bacterium]MCF8377322.1 DUF4440 domain-containing protein [Bacteroidales bacterium]
MKKTRIIKNGIFFFLSGLLFYSCAQKTGDVSKDVEAVNNSIMEAFEKGDAAAIASYYTSDAQLFPPNTPAIEGAENIRQFWKSGMERGIKKAIFETRSAKSNGNTAVEEGMFKLFARGDYLISEGKYILTWEKVNGDWKITRDMWNKNAPAKQMAAENDTMWVVRYRVKPAKREQFEKFNFNHLAVAANKIDPKLKNSVRFLRPVNQNDDGSFTYIYLMDPVIDPTAYDIKPVLRKAYGKEKASECYKMFNACLQNKEMKVNVVVQTAW